MSEYLRHDSFELTSSLAGTGVIIPTVTNRDNILAVDVRHFNSIFVQLTGTWSATVTWETSQDGTNWVGQVASNITSNNNQGTSTTSTGIFCLASSGKYFRLRCSAYTSGTIIAMVVVSSASPISSVVSVYAGTITPSPSTATGASTWHHLISAATTNATSVKASAGVINEVVVSNNGAAVAYFKTFDKASAPTVGTDTPVMSVLIPINGTVVIPGGYAGMRHATGIAYAITGGMPVADTTAVGAAQVSVSINYT